MGLLRLIGLGVRVGLAGGSVYLLHQQGVWGDSTQGAVAYDKLKSTKLSELVGPEVAAQVPDLTMPTEVTSAIDSTKQTISSFTQNKASYWNCGVAKVVDGLEALPETVVHYSMQAVDTIKENAK